MPRSGWLIVLLLFAVSPVALAQSELPLVALEPIVRLANGKVTACGLKAAFGNQNENKASFEVLLQRAGATATVVMSVETKLENATVRILRPTPLATFREQQNDGNVQFTASADDASATEFLRDTMTFGADVQLSAPSEMLSLKLLGPIPPSVRAAYLNCAGDIYVPGE